MRGKCSYCVVSVSVVCYCVLSVSVVRYCVLSVSVVLLSRQLLYCWSDTNDINDTTATFCCSNSVTSQFTLLPFPTAQYVSFSASVLSLLSLSYLLRMVSVDAGLVCLNVTVHKECWKIHPVLTDRKAPLTRWQMEINSHHKSRFAQDEIFRHRLPCWMAAKTLLVWEASM